MLIGINFEFIVDIIGQVNEENNKIINIHSGVLQ